MRFHLFCILALFALVGHALAADRYALAGVPSTNRVWSGDDYAKTLEILEAKKALLPSWSDRAGAALLTRFVSEDNFAIAANKSLPREQRVKDFQKILH